MMPSSVSARQYEQAAAPSVTSGLRLHGRQAAGGRRQGGRRRGRTADARPRPVPSSIVQPSADGADPPRRTSDSHSSTAATRCRTRSKGSATAAAEQIARAGHTGDRTRAEHLDARIGAERGVCRVGRRPGDAEKLQVITEKVEEPAIILLDEE